MEFYFSLFFVLVVYFSLVIPQQEFECETDNDNWPGKPGCPCKCIRLEGLPALNRVIVDNNNCQDVVIRNKNFETVNKDVIIDAPHSGTKKWRLEISDSAIDSVANLATASIGSEKVVYESVMISNVRSLLLSDIQPILDTHSSSLQQLQLIDLYGMDDNPLMLSIFSQIHLFEFGFCASKISLEEDTFIFPGTSTDYSSFTGQPWFIIQSSPTAVDDQIKFWFANTNTHLW